MIGEPLDACYGMTPVGWLWLGMLVTILSVLVGWALATGWHENRVNAREWEKRQEARRQGQI